MASQKSKKIKAESSISNKVLLLGFLLILLGAIGTQYKAEAKKEVAQNSKNLSDKKEIDCNKKVSQAPKDNLASIINGKDEMDNDCVFMGCSQFFQ